MASWFSSLDFWEKFEYAATAVVLVSALGEYCAEFTEWPQKWGYKKPLSKLSTIVLIVGLAGELIGVFRTSQLSNRIIASLQLQAGQASRDAETAKAQAAASDLARAKLEKSMMWRHLSKQQGDAFCAALPKRVLTHVTVTSSSQDSEAFRYAVDFNQALHRCIVSAGLPASGGVDNSFWGQDVAFGVWVRYTRHLTLDSPTSKSIVFNPRKRRALAVSVRNALEASGASVAGVSDAERGIVDIYVGPRFPPEEK